MIQQNNQTLTENQAGARASISVCSIIYSLSHVAELSLVTTIVQRSQRSLYHPVLVFFVLGFTIAPLVCVYFLQLFLC